MIGQLCTRPVVTAAEDESVAAAAHRMAEYDVGTVVVVTRLAQPIGIVTDRDIVKRVVASGLDPEKMPVSAIMTREVQTVDESAPIEKALQIMAGACTRRLIVTGGSFQVR